MNDRFPIQRLNENSVLITFGEVIDESLPSLISHTREMLLKHFKERIVDTIPAYTTLLVIFDDEKITYSLFREQLSILLTEKVNTKEKAKCKVLNIPVLYSSEVAPDLLTIAQKKSISVEQVIELHCGISYSVYAVGFSPGFAYLGEIHQSLATPRLHTPRLNVPAGSVGIAEKQTGIYPSDSPGGWNIIGKTPLTIFDAKTSLNPIQMGDKIKFYSINHSEFEKLYGTTLSRV